MSKGHQDLTGRLTLGWARADSQISDFVSDGIKIANNVVRDECDTRIRPERVVEAICATIRAYAKACARPEPTKQFGAEASIQDNEHALVCIVFITVSLLAKSRNRSVERSGLGS